MLYLSMFYIAAFIASLPLRFHNYLDRRSFSFFKKPSHRTIPILFSDFLISRSAVTFVTSSLFLSLVSVAPAARIGTISLIISFSSKFGSASE